MEKTICEATLGELVAQVVGASVIAIIILAFTGLVIYTFYKIIRVVCD